jgi:hypothetical protein
MDIGDSIGKLYFPGTIQATSITEIRLAGIAQLSFL